MPDTKPAADSFSYDDVPYPSASYFGSAPASIAAVAHLLQTPYVAPDEASVLELGCADGMNLIPLAARNPKARFVGVDLSAVQIDRAKASVAELGLKNIELRQASIMDVDKSWGNFDYIIAHGVFSWIPDAVQEKIMSLCANLLTENGLAYISYNVLPGWNPLKTVRDMMIFHAANFSKPAEKILEARRMLNFVHENAGGGDSYSKMLKTEIDLLKNLPDGYLYHEHLEDANQPMYFHQFAEMAGKAGLGYVSDSSLGTSYLGNFSEKARETFSKLNDLVRVEQYLDFLTNRRFRMSILCRAGARVVRNIPTERFADIAYISNLSAPEEVDGKYQFKLSTGANITTSTESMKRALSIFHERPGQIVTFDEIVAAGLDVPKKDDKKDTGEKPDPATVRAEILNTLTQMVVRGVMPITLAKGTKRGTPDLKKPTVPHLARVTLRERMGAANDAHQWLSMNAVCQKLAPLMDGSRDRDALIDSFVDLCVKGELSANQADKPVTDPEELRKLLPAGLDNALGILAGNGLLE